MYPEIILKERHSATIENHHPWIFSGNLRRAADQARVCLHVLKAVRQAPDHPLSLYFPEAAYLKSFICRVERK
jgi:23S rRNA G2069 N7-methylase RlmK/C1962 C5-methylase RlmI